MLRIITILLLIFALVACGAESDTDVAPTEADVVETITDEPTDEAETDESVETIEADAQVEETEDADETMSDPAETAEAESDQVDTSESVEETSEYSYELTETYILDMIWGGKASFQYPTGWRTVAGDTEVTIYGDDRYTISLSVNNNPSNNAQNARTVLNRLNQSEEILSVEQDGKEILYTSTLGGNAITGALVINENTYAITQLVNTRGRELELMLPTMLEILASVEIVEESE